MPFTFLDYGAIVLSLGLALVLTPLVQWLARRGGMVARPRLDRWHKKPTALLGGIAIFLAVAIVYAVALPKTTSSLYVLGASAFLFLVGLVDDLRPFKPYQKLIGQVMGAAIIVYGGLALPWTPWPLVNMALTIFWLVGITNAVNLLDNMDGLAGGVALIASVFLAAHFLSNGNASECLLLIVFAAALLGFLVYNTNPASIFMGDCGSMFIGLFLAGAALLDNPGGRTRSFLPVLVVPVLVLFIPIFDITFVTLLRKLSGRAASQGGRDHTSHRLVALGLSERRAVALLYALATVSGLLSLGLRNLSLDLSLAAIVCFSLGLTFLGVYLAGVKVYSEEEVRAAQKQPLVAFLVDLSYKRRMFEVVLDVILILLAYYSANVLFLGEVWGADAWDQFFRTAPILVFIKMAVFLIMGVYQGLWRYVSVDNLIRYAKAVLVGSIFSVLAMLLLFRFEGLSRSVFLLDGLLLLMLLCGTRLAFRTLRSLLPHPGANDSRRVLIYGAGDAGELLVRELRNNQNHSCIPVGFLDDDPMKKGRIIHGLRVLGGNGTFLSICEQQQVSEVVISSTKFTDQRIQEILEECRRANIIVKRMRIHIEKLSDEEAN